MTSRKTLAVQIDPIEEQAKGLLARPYARRLTPDDSGGFTATIQEFPGCIADGESPNEALANLEAAALSWIEAQLDLGQPIPEPLALYGYSGKLALRIPRGLHKRVAEQALSEGVSINQFLTAAISSVVGAASVAEKLIEQFKPILNATVKVWLSQESRFTVQVLDRWEKNTASTGERSRYLGEYLLREIPTYNAPLTLDLSHDHA